MKHIKTFIVKVYDTANLDDKGRILDSFDDLSDAMRLEKEENKKNLLSGSCEIAVVEPLTP